MPRSIARSRGRSARLSLRPAPAARPACRARARAGCARTRRCCAPSSSGAGCATARSVMPTMLPTTAIRRNATQRSDADAAGRVGRTDRVLLDRPVGAARPVLLLPDRHRFLQRVDRELGGVERDAAVRRRDDDDDRRLRQLRARRRGAAARRARRRASAGASRPRSRSAPARPGPRRPRTSSPTTPGRPSA